MSDPTTTLTVRLDPTTVKNDGTALEVLGVVGGLLPQVGDSVARLDSPSELREVTAVADFGRPGGAFTITLDEPLPGPGYYAPALTCESNLDLTLLPQT